MDKLDFAYLRLTLAICQKKVYPPSRAKAYALADSYSWTHSNVRPAPLIRFPAARPIPAAIALDKHLLAAQKAAS